ncbi:lipoprotein [Streptomyces albiaxialis]|uniref:Lipoprotein n=1 Tax=Streptomyces albiaxialis TaxID=329523 RepID=A0ABN2X546_9ACTN
MAVRWHGLGGAVAASALVSVTLFTATGCAEGGAAADDPVPPGGSRPGASAVRQAADTLYRAGTSRVRTSMEMDSGGTRVTVEGTGGFDYTRRSGRLVVSLPQGASGARPGERRPVTELIAPGALYMKNRGEGVPADKWVRVETATLPDGNLVTGGATDPVSAAELLRGARKIRYEGRQELDGVPVWHYSGSVDIEAAAVAAPPYARRQLKAAEKGFSGHEVPFDAYLDGQARLRKVQHRFTFASAGGGIDVASTTRLHGFGAPVRVVMPPSRDIYAGKIALP